MSYDGLVWCVRTDTGNFLAERNGLMTFTGNSMPELVEGHGWLIDPASYEMSGLLSWQALPNQSQIVEALNDAYQNEDKRRKYGQDSHVFAQGYDYEKVILPQWMKYFDETGEIIRKSETATKATVGQVSA